MLSSAERQDLIETIRRFPNELETVVAPLSGEQLTTPFLAGEWTIAQNVHHTADSHMNSYIRLKLILTEELPPLTPYAEPLWAQFADATPPDLTATLQLLRGLHRRWVVVFESLTDTQWQRRGIHPEIGTISAEDLLVIYAEHCEAHLDQIQHTLSAAGDTF